MSRVLTTAIALLRCNSGDPEDLIDDQELRGWIKNLRGSVREDIEDAPLFELKITKPCEHRSCRASYKRNTVSMSAGSGHTDITSQQAHQIILAVGSILAATKP